MKNEQKRTGKLATYSVIMLLAAIIIIIIAAMADNREEMFKTQLDQSTQTNMTIQNEIVSLKDENYILKQENESLKKTSVDFETQGKIISEALSLFNEDKAEEAKAKLAEIDKESLSEETVISLYEAATHIIAKGR